MNPFATLAEASPVVGLIVRWTVLLSLAWLVHRGLSGRNPRLQVLLWRVTVVGIVLIATLSWGPPLVEWRLANPDRSTENDAPGELAPTTRPTTNEPVPHPLTTVSPPTPEDIRIEPRDLEPLRIESPGEPDIVRDVEVDTDFQRDIQPQSSTWTALRLAPWLLSAWAAGIVLLFARLALAMYRLHRIIRRAPEAPDWVVRECRAIADQLGGAPALRVLRSAEVTSPCLAGFVRPILLLPERQCRIEAQDDLNSIAAHEIAHARGHDVPWNFAAQLASAVLWFHPLAWRLRAAHASACDAVCDAVAVGLLGDVTPYAKTLARLALQAVAPPPEPGLAMARTSDVVYRINALNRRVFKAPLPRGLVASVMFAGAGLVVLIGGLGFTRADEGPTDKVKAEVAQTPSKTSPPKAEAPANPGQLEVQAISAKTISSLEGVSISYYGRFDGKLIEGTVTTDNNGRAKIEWPAKATINFLKLTASKSKYVPIHIHWNEAKHPVTLPAFKELKFASGTTIGGLVRDEAGQPIRGVQINIAAPSTESEQSNLYFTLGTPKTDNEGRWRLDEAPANFAGLLVQAKHPQYLPLLGSPIRNIDSLLVLKKGVTVKGHVVDSSGNPIKGARAAFGPDLWASHPPQATTDEHGNFALENCDREPSIVTVQADGFAPELREVRPEGQPAPLKFELGPAATLRVKVVNAQGQPIAGAFFATDTWRGHRSIQFRANSDKDGRIEWRSAPKDVVLCDLGKEGYAAQRHVPLTASNQEQVITLGHAPTITGFVVGFAVTGAKSEQPMPGTQIIPGYRSEEKTDTYYDGHYTLKFNKTRATYLLRVDAPGDKPVESRLFLSNERKATYDFVLQRSDELSGTVFGTDGRAAADVQVALATREHRVQLSQGGFQRNDNVPIVKTGPDGRFAIVAPNDEFVLVALSDAGYAEIRSDEFAKRKTLSLQPWGKIEGLALIGKKPAANQEILFNSLRHTTSVLYVFNNHHTRTNEQGRFTFDRVVPGPGSVSRYLITVFQGGRARSTPYGIETVEVKAGATTEVRLGGKGRPVIGRVVLDGTPKAPVDWRYNEPVVIQQLPTQSGQGTGVWNRLGSGIDKEGRFRVEDVPAGRYDLTIPVNQAPNPESFGSGAKIGDATLSITVPEGPQDEPIDLGEIKARLFATLEPGDFAPDFVAHSLDGRAIHLRDYQGKLVLLDFWASWSHPYLAELKEIRETFADDPRFALLSLSCDPTRELAAEFVKKNGLDWPQGFAGYQTMGLAKRYKVRAVPATFLVGPDGRILADNLSGDALKQAIRDALKNDKLFASAASVVRPPRILVTRFAAAAPATAPLVPPSVVVMDDSDSDFTEGRTHHDRLRLLGESGKEIQNLDDFNTCQSIGIAHTVVLDRDRGRIYAAESVADRVTALDRQGHKLWQVSEVPTGALAIDPKTGNLWCTGGPTLDYGETVVLDPSGNEVATFPVTGNDIAYDPLTDGFWLAGNGTLKLNRQGKEVFHKSFEGWACVSVDVNPKDGSAWIIERSHPQNRLWHLDAQGNVLRTWAIGTRDPMAIAYDSRNDIAWVVNDRSEVLRFRPNGQELPPLPIKAVAIAISPTTGQVWVNTTEETIRLDDAGQPAARSPFHASSLQSWLAAF